MISRRDFFRYSGASGASYMLAHALGGCASDPATMPLEPLPDDPMGRWWMSGNYAPVPDEIEAFDLEVEGALPPELDGLFVRNGPNPYPDGSPHWFMGDGMLHGVRISGGQALWYRNRYVDTLAHRSGMGDNIAANRANTSIKAHAGKLLALYEAAVPVEIDPSDLTTQGDYDFAGALSRPMTAHPKIDARTGEMFFIGYSPFPPYLTYHVVDATGALTRSVEIAMDHSSMMHDVQVTESHALVFDLPVHFDLALLEGGGGFPFRWVPEAASRIGILPRDGSSAEPTWVEIDTCYMFHTFNAFEDAEGGIVLEGCRMPSLWQMGLNDMSESQVPWRWRIDPEAGTVSETQLEEFTADFPIVDARRHGREHRMNYLLRFRDADPMGIATPNAIVKMDRQTGASDVWDSGDIQPDETLFVPGGDAEDEGWLMTFAFDRTTRRSEVLVLDASAVASGPVARVKLPRRVPHGFHGTWLPAV